MPDKKKTEQEIEFEKFKDTLFNNPCNTNNFADTNWFILTVLLLLGFFPFSNSNNDFLKGKIEAYENVLKGFDDNGR